MSLSVVLRKASPVFRPTVALLHEDTRTLSIWQEAIGDASRVVIATTVEELEGLLLAHPIEVVAAEWRDGLVESIRRKRPEARVVHVGSVGPELVRGLRHGYDVDHAATPADLAAKVGAALGETPSRPLRRAAGGVTFQDEALSRSFAVVDVSNHGFSYEVPFEDGIDEHFAGRRLANVILNREGHAVLRGAEAIVRHVSIATNGYRVGCEIERAWLRPASETTVVERDGARIRALVSRALDEAGVIFEQEHAAHMRVVVDASHAHLDEAGAIVAQAYHRFTELSPVKGRFELGDRSYSFVSVVGALRPLAVRAPVALEVTRAPANAMFRPPPASPVRVELSARLASVFSHVRAVDEVSPDAIAIFVDPEAELFPEGMIFENVVLHFGGRVVRCRGHVRSLTLNMRDADTLRCIVALDDLSEDGRRTIVDALMERRFPSLEDASSLRADELLDFFRATKFLPPEKEAVLAPIMPLVRSTFEALGSERSDVFKGLALRKDGALVAYVSGILAYSGTFMWQHLAARSGRALGRTMILSIMAHRLEEGRFDHAKFWFLKDNLFPVRIFESFARKVADPMNLDFRLYAHVPLAVDAKLAAPGADFGARLATEDDLAIIERWCAAHERTVLFRSDDLTRKRLRLGAVDERYKVLGLSRRREVFVATCRGRRVGFALAELSSAGLNLYGGLSSFRLITTSDDPTINDGARLALLAALQGFYGDEGRPQTMGLVPAVDAPAYERQGIAPNAFSYCLTLHRSRVPSIMEHVDRVTQSATIAQSRRTKEPTSP